MSDQSDITEDEGPGYATLCMDPDCGAMFFAGDDGFDRDECFECGGDTQETPA